MLVSNFELLIKRIATLPSTTPSSISSVFRRVVQGYFLSVSNLESSRTIRLALTLTISRASGNREINSSNVQCIFDNGFTNNLVLPITRSLSSNTNFTKFQTASFDLRPLQTGLITILPNVFPFISNPNPDLEIRGFVEINQRRRFTFPFPTLSTPESEILITPETRGTFLDNDYPTNPTVNELDFDQISYSLPTASGKSNNIVERIPPIVFDPVTVRDNLTNKPFLSKKLQQDNPDLTVVEIEDIVEIISKIEKEDDMMKLVKSFQKAK